MLVAGIDFSDLEYVRMLPSDKIGAVLQVYSDLYAEAKKSRVVGRRITRAELLDSRQLREVANLVETLMGDEAAKVPHRVDRHLFGITMSPSPRERAIERIEDLYLRAKAIWMARSVGNGSDAPTAIELSITDGSKKDIQRLISEIKKIVTESEELIEDHKLRLMKIASALEVELLKTRSRFQSFLDAVLESAEVLGEAGEKAKPAVDRVREIFGIAERSQKDLKRLGADEPPKQLPAPRKQDA